MTESNELSLREICDFARELTLAKGWPARSPSERALHLFSEVGEVCNEIIELQFVAEVGGPTKRLGHELYDVIWNICDLANMYGIDLDAAGREKQGLLSSRVWPEQGPVVQ